MAAPDVSKLLSKAIIRRSPEDWAVGALVVGLYCLFSILMLLPVKDLELSNTL